MLTSIRFTENLRKVFKKDEVVTFKPLTILVGDNGSGKSTLIEEICRHGAKRSYDRPVSVIETDHKGIIKMSLIKIDFEKDNLRTNPGLMSEFGVEGILSRFRSHGENSMDMLVNQLSKVKDAIILLDEPDQALSIRSILRIAKVFKEMIKNNCQIIAAVHSETMIKEFDAVLSLEHKLWISSADFIRLQHRPKKLKTVDIVKSKEKLKYKVSVVRDTDHGKWFIGKNDTVVHDLRLIHKFRNSDTAKKAIDRLESKPEIRIARTSYSYTKRSNDITRMEIVSC